MSGCSKTLESGVKKSLVGLVYRGLGGGVGCKLGVVNLGYSVSRI